MRVTREKDGTNRKERVEDRNGNVEKTIQKMSVKDVRKVKIGAKTNENEER